MWRRAGRASSATISGSTSTCRHIYTVSEVILRWETAFGADYQVQVSTTHRAGRRSRTVTGGNGGVDDLTGLSGTGRYVRILGTRRGTRGYRSCSLEVYGNEVGSARRMTWRSINPRSPAAWPSRRPPRQLAKAVDGDPSTRWSSAFSDPQWIYVDVGQQTCFHAASGSCGRRRTPPISNSALGRRDELEDRRQRDRQHQHTNDVPMSGTGRYVRMYGDAARYRVGLFALLFEVFGSPGSTDGFRTTEPFRPSSVRRGGS